MDSKILFMLSNHWIITSIVAIISIEILTKFSGKYYPKRHDSPFTSFEKCSQGAFAHTQKAGYLEDILLSDRQPQFGKSIFFLETSKANWNRSQPLWAELNARQACAIESAALMNPVTDVFVLFVGHDFRLNSTDQGIPQKVLSYENVHLRKLHFCSFAFGTPVYEWLTTGKFETMYPVEHMSDFLRLLTLWRYGGTYLDLDVMILKNLELIPSNFVGAESKEIVGNAVLNFAANGIGHEIVGSFLRDFQENFKGFRWFQNGPCLISRVLQKFSKTRQILRMSQCKHFTVFPPETFYAITTGDLRRFFMPEYFEEMMNKTQNSLAIHLYNSTSKRFQAKIGSSAAYVKIAERHCPVVYASCEDFF